MQASVAAAAVAPSSATRLYGQGRSRKAPLLHGCGPAKTGLRCGRGAFDPRSPRFPLFLCQRRPDRSRQNVNGGDTDEMFDELFQKYGKVVYSDGNRKRPSAEADDDAESLSFAVALAKVANEVDAIGSRIRDIAEKQFNKNAAGDTKPNSWTLLDFGDVVVHIFLPQQRAFYNLEEFYGNATQIELPFDTQSPFRK